MEYVLLTKEQLVDPFLRKVRLLRVVDGDTVDVYIQQGFTQGFEERIRLNRINTPEKNGTEGPAGKWVTQKVIDWLGEVDYLWLHSKSWNMDRYGRCLGDIYRADGENLNQWLLSQGYGWPTDEKGYIMGNRDINRLNLPTGLKQEVLINQRT